MSSQVTTVIFDVGNVLIEWDPNHLYRKLIPDDQEREAFLATVCTSDWNLQQDLGRSWDEAVALLTTEHPQKADLIEAYSSGWHDMVPGAIHGSVEILETLKENQTPLYAITNFSSEKWVEAKLRFPFLATSFLDTVVSAHERLAKPDPQIYEIMLKRNGLEAQRCVFIDDSPANVTAARDLGMEAIHFTGPEALKNDLAALDLPISPVR